MHPLCSLILFVSSICCRDLSPMLGALTSTERILLNQLTFLDARYEIVNFASSLTTFRSAGNRGDLKVIVDVLTVAEAGTGREELS